MKKTLFDECSLYTYDEYWQEIFSSCGRNKFPKGLSYNKAKRIIYIRQGKLRETIPLPLIPAEVFTTMMLLFRKLGLKSPTDKFQTKLDIATSQSSINILDRDWKNIFEIDVEFDKREQQLLFVQRQIMNDRHFFYKQAEQDFFKIAGNIFPISVENVYR